jgi:hypothetical protein
VGLVELVELVELVGLVGVVDVTLVCKNTDEDVVIDEDEAVPMLTTEVELKTDVELGFMRNRSAA